MIQRILQPVPGYEKQYSVTPIGEVFGHFRKAFLKPTICNKGYYRYRLSANNKKFSRYAHRLVGLTYISNPKNKPHINHKDCDTLNNHITNLEWCTHAENMAYSAKLGRKKGMKEDKNPAFLHHITGQEATDIRRLLREGVTQIELAELFACSQSLISQIKRNIRRSIKL